MGFFGALGRMIVGEPAFEPQRPSSTQPDRPESGAVSSSAKIVPVVQVVRVDSRIHGDSIEVYGHVRNDSTVDVELNKTYVLGATHQIDVFLHPGEERQCLLYAGPAPHDVSQHQAEIVFKDTMGDYFKAVHLVSFHLQADGIYNVTNLQLQPPIRDM